jgi:hypothetical protein
VAERLHEVDEGQWHDGLCVYVFCVYVCYVCYMCMCVICVLCVFMCMCVYMIVPVAWRIGSTPLL